MMADPPSTTPPPTTSPTRDTYTHHTSPADPAGKQVPLVKPAPIPQVPVAKVAREVTGTVRKIKMPDAVYRHPNPVGRPKNWRG